MYGDLMRESAVIDVHSLDTKYRLVPYVRVWHRISYGSSRISSVFAELLQNYPMGHFRCKSGFKLL